MMRTMWSQQTLQLIKAACTEDLADIGDITSSLLSNPDKPVAARVVARGMGVVSGLAIAPYIVAGFAHHLGQVMECHPALRDQTHAFIDSDTIEPGQTVAVLKGPLAAVLTTERTLLNFLGRMTGVATMTSRYVQAARLGNKLVKILDTRKTIPGWRELDKYAVRCGGGDNHRTGLFDAVLIKDNHIADIPCDQLAHELPQLIAKLGEKAAKAKFIEVEVDTLEQYRQVITVDGVDFILIDNFTLADMREAVRLRNEADLKGKLLLEASGGVTLETITDIAATGVDRISVGAVTHSAPNFDFGLDL